MLIRLETTRRSRDKACRNQGLHQRTFNPTPRVLKVGWNVGFKLFFYLLLFQIVLRVFFGELPFLSFLLMLFDFVISSFVVFFSLQISLFIQKVEFLFAFLFQFLQVIYFCILGRLILQLFHIFCDLDGLLLFSFCLLVLSVLSKVGALQDLRYLHSVLSVDSQNLLDEVDLDVVCVMPKLPNLLEKMSGFFISVITSSPVSPRKGANPWISSNNRIPSAHTSILQS